MPFDGAFIHDSPLTWAALDSSKPGRGTEECWVLHADSVWTMAHLELNPEEKEIDGFLNISTSAVDFHRKNIRRKLGLKSRRANLRSHLLYLAE